MWGQDGPTPSPQQPSRGDLQPQFAPGPRVEVLLSAEEVGLLNVS
jgi:hypothetical protein